MISSQSSIQGEDTDQKVWHLAASKIPSLDLDVALRRLLVNLPNLAEQKLQSMQGQIRERERYREIDSHYEEYREEHRYRESMELRMISMPFPIGESIMINHAICTAGDYGLAPLTDEGIHHKILMYKYEKLAKSNTLRHLLKDYGFIEDMKANLTVAEVLRYQLKGFNNIDDESIMDFRKSHKNELTRLRVKMSELSAKIQSEFWSPEFEREVKQISNSEVTSALNDINEAVESARDSIIRHTPMAAVTSISFLLSVTPYFPLSVGLAAAAGALILDDYLGWWQTKQKNSRNGYAFLFEAQKLNKVSA